MRSQIKKYGQDALDAIYAGDAVWAKAIDEFKLKSIEASAFVLEISFVDEKSLSKNFNLSRVKLGAWAKVNTRPDAKELEDNTREVVRFVVKELNELFGIEEQKLTFKEKLAAHRAAKNSL